MDQPGILEHVKFGLNETAKSLEQHISKLRQSLLKETPLTEETVTPRMILACRWDVNPPDLFSHIPLLVASANTLATIYDAKFSTTTLSEIKLVNLPKGSENSLSEAVGIRRLSVVTLNVGCSMNKLVVANNASSLQSKTLMGPRLTGLLDKIPRLATPWLIPTTNPTVLTSVLQSTHIKHVKTTAPTDLRAVKQERGQARKAAKQRRKESRRATERPISTMDTSNEIQPEK
jgi:ribonuclease P/MRP protein subunit POP3